MATGQWTVEDEDLLAAVLERAEAMVLPRVAWRWRHGLRNALAGVVVALLTEGVAGSGWEQRRQELARPWLSVVGAWPDQACHA